MAAWSGFTDDDLRKMRHPTQTDDHAHIANSNNKMTVQRQQQRQKKVTAMRPSLSDATSKPTTARQEAPGTIDPSMKLSAQVGQKEGNQHPASSVTNSLHETEAIRETRQYPAEETESAANDKNSEHYTQSERGYIKELNEDEAMSVELDNVQKFQQRQKVIEEANKRKRALLSKAIVDRQKKAKAEAAKLMTVQQELNHLDTLLTADVNIIRDKIETASLEYMDARKRYEKAEKEFVAAKMDLFSKGEAKEHLTEHLYTIIHQNEVRKARKLVELMEKLAMDVTPEEMELTIPAIPQLTNFTAVSTLHDPYHSKNTGNTDSNKNNIAGEKVAPIEENTKLEANNSLLNISSNDTKSISQLAIEKPIDILVCTEEDSSTCQHQNEILQLNQTVQESGLDNHLETTPASQTIIRTDNVGTSHSNYHNPSTPNTKVETKTTDTPKELQVTREGTYVGSTSHDDAAKLLRSSSEVLNTANVSPSETVSSPQPSSNANSGKGWTLPFS